MQNPLATQTPRFRPALAALACLSFLLTAATAGAQVTLTTPQLSVAIDPHGVRSIRLHGRLITSAGGMNLWDDLSIPLTPGTIPTPQPGPDGSARLDHDRAIVDQTAGNLHLIWTYTLSGYDLAADIAITNNSDHPFARLFFQLPQFQFTHLPTGNMHSWHYTYYAPQWASLAHPGIQCPLAVSVAHDDTFAVAIHCPSHFDHPVLVNSNWFNNVIPAQCVPYVYVQDTIQPGATGHVRLNLRITDQPALADRVGAYVADFQHWAGPMQYEPDDRPVIGCSPESPSWIKPGNPLGLSRRLDTPMGVVSFENLIFRAAPYCQGPLFWQPQGANPRGVEYRPDFDVWPPAIRQNLPPLLAWCTAQGMRPGLQTRPLCIAVPLSPTADAPTDLDPANPAQVAALLARFDHTLAAGAREYYLDSFGSDINSYRLMLILRRHLGPHIPTYSENTTDLMLPLSGGYCERRNASLDTTWFTLETLQIFRLLYPASSFICVSRATPNPLTGTDPHALDQFAAGKLSPIIPDAASFKMAPFLKTMRNTYYTANSWGPAAGKALIPSTQP